MQVTATIIPDVLVVEPKVFGDARGFSLKVLTPKLSSKPLASSVNLCRTTTRNLLGTFCVDCITRFRIRKEN